MRIVLNIFLDPAKNMFVAYYMIVKPGLPLERDIVVIFVFCYPDFKTTNNLCNVFGLGTKFIVWHICFYCRDVMFSRRDAGSCVSTTIYKWRRLLILSQRPMLPPVVECFCSAKMYRDTGFVNGCKQ